MTSSHITSVWHQVHQKLNYMTFIRVIKQTKKKTSSYFIVMSSYNLNLLDNGTILSSIYLWQCMWCYRVTCAYNGQRYVSTISVTTSSTNARTEKNTHTYTNRHKHTYTNSCICVHARIHKRHNYTWTWGNHTSTRFYLL